MSRVSASAVVITHNRAEILADCLDRILRHADFEEVIVVDDGSTDNTADVVAQFAPYLRYIRRTQSGGPSAARNTGAAQCNTDFIFHFDDDSLLQDNSFFGGACKAFSHSCVGLVALPFRNKTYSDEVFDSAPDVGETYVQSTFTACAYAVRASALHTIGGFREFFFYMGEESDLSIRFLDRGLMTACIHCTPIDHIQPLHRSTYAAHFYARRNDILADFLNIPFPLNYYHVLRATVHGVLFGMKTRALPVTLRGIADGYINMWKRRAERKPVRTDTFRSFEMLRKKGPVLIDSIRMAV